MSPSCALCRAAASRAVAGPGTFLPAVASIGPTIANNDDAIISRSAITAARSTRVGGQALFFSSTPSSSSTTTPVWERSARRVKNTDLEKNNPYMDLIRDTHDPSMHLKTLEDELKGTIGKALGKQGEKILYHIRLMHQALQQDDDPESLSSGRGCDCNKNNNKDDNAQSRRKLYNEYRKQAVQARWEFIVQRQAAGFLVDNHKYVMKHYPIPDALPEDDDESDDNKEIATDSTNHENNNAKFGDQLDWWQRIGRWR